MSNFKQHFDELLAQASEVVVLSHKRPDIDAIASVLSVGSYLDSSFPDVKVTMVFEDNNVGVFDYLPKATQIEWVENLSDVVNRTEVVIFLDGNALHRFSDFHQDFAGDYKTVCIDHHERSDDTYDLELIVSESVSTCSVLEREIFSSDDDLTPDVALLLAEGIMGDTGGLTYIFRSNSEVFLSLKRLVDSGNLDIAELKRRYSSITQKDFEVFREFVLNTRTADLANLPNIAYSFLANDSVTSLMAAEGGKKHFLSYVSNNIENHPWSFAVRHNPDRPGEFKISFRSTKQGPNVRLICEQLFDGGGHDRSAAGTYRLKPGEDGWGSKQVAEKVLEILHTYTEDADSK